MPLPKLAGCGWHCCCGPAHEVGPWPARRQMIAEHSRVVFDDNALRVGDTLLASIQGVVRGQAADVAGESQLHRQASLALVCRAAGLRVQTGMSPDGEVARAWLR